MWCDFLLYSQLSYQWPWFLFDSVGNYTCVSRLLSSLTERMSCHWFCEAEILFSPFLYPCIPLPTSSLTTGSPWAFLLGPRNKVLVWGYNWTPWKSRNTFCGWNIPSPFTMCRGGKEGKVEGEEAEPQEWSTELLLTVQFPTSVSLPSRTSLQPWKTDSDNCSWLYLTHMW